MFFKRFFPYRFYLDSQKKNNKMVTSQKRLAASIKRCGVNKIWLDPNETTEIKQANSRLAIRKLLKDGLIIRKPQVIHSRDRVRTNFFFLSKSSVWL